MVTVPQHVRDAKEKADKEAKEMAEAYEIEKRGGVPTGIGSDAGSRDNATPEKPEVGAAVPAAATGSGKGSLANAPQVRAFVL